MSLTARIVSALLAAVVVAIILKLQLGVWQPDTFFFIDGDDGRP